MKTELLDKIKDEVAKDKEGVNAWYHLPEHCMPSLWPEVCRRYAIEVAKEKWVTKDEIFHMLVGKNYCKEIAEELSQMWADSYQGMYEKGVNHGIQKIIILRQAYDSGMSEYFRMHDYRNMYQFWEHFSHALTKDLIVVNESKLYTREQAVDPKGYATAAAKILDALKLVIGEHVNDYAMPVIIQIMKNNITM